MISQSSSADKAHHTVICSFSCGMLPKLLGFPQYNEEDEGINGLIEHFVVNQVRHVS